MVITAVEGSPDPFWSEAEEAAMRAAIEETEHRVRTAPKMGERLLHMAVFEPRADLTQPLPYGTDPLQRWNLPGYN